LYFEYLSYISTVLVRLISGDEQGAEASAEIDERVQKEYDQHSFLIKNFGILSTISSYGITS
jgi:hypothetical protein